VNEYSTPTFDVNLNPDGFLVDLDSLYEVLSRLHDSRHARGVRYALVTVLMFVLLAKLAGQDRVYGISQWVKHRQQRLAEAFHLATPRAPSPQTYSRLLGRVIAIEEFEQAVQEYFASPPHAGRSVTIAIDGKTLRGTIRAGQSHGRHLLAAYLPQEGWVLLQVEVEHKGNEILAAPHLLNSLDLRDKTITGDAMLAQRELSIQIVQAGGDYVWTVKENQPQLLQDIQTLFAPEPVVKGFSPAAHDDFRSAQTTDKAHGRLEQRTLTASRALHGYVDWPYAEQVFQLERRVQRMADGTTTVDVAYGVTSLTATEASPARLLDLVRQHWQIENGLHYRRDETLREDWCHRRVGEAPRAMALLNNLVVGLVLRQGKRNLPEARRHYDAHLDEAVSLLVRGQG
jgi:predicted transposase YbfD/YdcC